jgi:branched-subunit amino acid aminotransferase/4-amino-4-deoxychorismate lyase
MKAYRHTDGTVTMFRPDMNMKRMNISAQRLALPVSVDHRVMAAYADDLSIGLQWKRPYRVHPATHLARPPLDTQGTRPQFIHPTRFESVRIWSSSLIIPTD